MPQFNDNYIIEAERTIAQRVNAAGIYLQGKVRENLSVPGTSGGSGGAGGASDNSMRNAIRLAGNARADLYGVTGNGQRYRIAPGAFGRVTPDDQVLLADGSTMPLASVRHFEAGGRQVASRGAGGKRIYGATRSRPGEFPRKQHGTLRQSIAHEHNPETLTSRVGSVLPYAKFLELGTRRMSPRPFLRRTLAMEQQKIVEIITGAGGASATP